MNHKALLVVSFGTAVAETREKTLEAIEASLRAAFPDRAFFRAWSSDRLRQKVSREESLHMDSVQDI